MGRLPNETRPGSRPGGWRDPPKGSVWSPLEASPAAPGGWAPGSEAGEDAAAAPASVTAARPANATTPTPLETATQATAARRRSRARSRSKAA